MRVSERIRDCLLLATSWLFAIAYTYTNIFPDPDLWGRLSMGTLFFQNGRFPYHDLFSYTAPHARWVDHEWLTGFAFYQILTRFGETGFLVFKYLMMLGLFALLFRLHRKVYKTSTLYAFYGLLALVDIYSVGLYATVRSHIFSFLFFLIELYMLERVRLGQKGKSSLWPLVPLLVLWGNLHGGIAMGLLLLGCYGLGEMLVQRNIKAGLFHWMLPIVAFLLLGVLNPYGPSYLSFLWHAWTLDRSKIGEWSHLKFDVWFFLGAQLVFLFGTLIPLLRWWFRDKQDPQEISRLLTPTLVMFWVIVMMLRAVRMQPFAAFVVIAYLPVFLDVAFIQRVLPQRFKQFVASVQSAFVTAIPGMVLALSLGMVLFLQSTVNLFKVDLADEMAQSNLVVTRYPMGAMNFLRSSPYHGNLLVHFGLGEFALWTLYPRFKVSMDGRYEEVYSQALFLKNHHCFNRHDRQDNWDSFDSINNGEADFLLMQVELPIVARLALSPLWQKLYVDGYFVVFARKSSLRQFPPVLAKSPLVNMKEISIGDMLTNADLKRFKTRDY